MKATCILGLTLLAGMALFKPVLAVPRVVLAEEYYQED
jgi:hypothetical protein